MARKSISFLIREVLLERGMISPYDFWKEFSRDTSYAHVVKYFWMLKKLGLIQEAKHEDVNSKGSELGKTYYMIVPGMEDHPAWANPARHLWSHLYVEKRKKG